MSSPDIPPPPLDRDALDADPHVQFSAWMDDARARGTHEPEAMALATAAPDGTPSARMVLLRGWGPDGYVWFTNYDSRKGAELAANPRAALVLHWDRVGRQIRLEGAVARTTREESDAYFASRHPGSQIGAWASPQSTPIASRDVLDREVTEAAQRFGEGPVSRPANWGGYRLTPLRFEFWQHRDNRLHDRFVYEPDGDGWSITRLAP
jgi:pyridoxamine 5'-phosphate oxidase